MGSAREFPFVHVQHFRIHRKREMQQNKKKHKWRETRCHWRGSITIYFARRSCGLENDDFSKRFSSQNKSELQFAHFGNWSECIPLTSFSSSFTALLRSGRMSYRSWDSLKLKTRKSHREVFDQFDHPTDWKFPGFKWNRIHFHRITKNAFEVGMCLTITEIISFHVSFRLHLRNFVEQCTFPLVKFGFVSNECGILVSVEWNVSLLSSSSAAAAALRCSPLVCGTAMVSWRCSISTRHMAHCTAN